MSHGTVFCVPSASIGSATNIWYQKKKIDTTKGKIRIVNGNRICRHVTEPFFSIKIHNGYYFLYSSFCHLCMNCMDIIGIRNNFLWEPHMQIYFYWLYHIKKSLCHIVNCIGFNRWYYLLAAWVTGMSRGRGAVGTPLILAYQFTLYQQGGKLCPPNYYPPSRFWDLSTPLGYVVFQSNPITSYSRIGLVLYLMQIL